MIFECKEWYHFRPWTYQARNPDLDRLNWIRLVRHFYLQGHKEQRIFADLADAHDRLSMKWLRGSGVEIGAGSYPTRLFGATSVVHADTDSSLFYGGQSVDHIFSLDDPALPHNQSYDFAIASHVLEHLDSFIRGLENLICLLKPGGIVYAAVPIISYLHDKVWMPHFDFQHHIEEYVDLLKFAKMHDQLVINEHARLHGQEFSIAENERFMHHKHNYDLDGWISLFVSSLNFLRCPAKIVDCSFGYERRDCILILQKASQ